MKISEKAMLVSLNISAWSGRKFDKTVSEEVATSHGTDAHRAGRFNKLLVNKEALKEIQTIGMAARNYQTKVTLPWFSDGSRIIPVDIYLDYARDMSDRKSKYDDAVRKMVNNYDALVRQAKIDLNGMFKDSDYPSSDQVRAKHSFNVRVCNLPDVEDFRVNLSSSEFESAKEEISQTLKDATDAAVTDVFERVRFQMEHMIKRIRIAEIDDGKGIRESMMGHIVDLANIIPKLNITGNPTLDSIADRMKKDLASFTADDLRDYASSREQATKVASEILDKVSAYI